jgi:hypothetical protein
VIAEPMTLAEVSNPNDTHYEPKKVTVIGFRREEVVMN